MGRQAAANLSVSTSSWTMRHPCETAYEQEAPKSGIFQSPISEVATKSPRVKFPPIRQPLVAHHDLQQPPANRLCHLLARRFPRHLRAFGAAIQDAGGFQIPRSCIIAICFSITSRLYSWWLVG
jgi:hypothetical protein